MDHKGESAVQVSLVKSVATFTAGLAAMTLNGGQTMLDIPTASTGGDLMISLRAVAVQMMGKSESTRKDVYENVREVLARLVPIRSSSTGRPLPPSSSVFSPVQLVI